ncbi:MAG TPA: GNAT family protein [Actinomycetota bacterium]|jgi:RimJ/RimL family protein N-acetyltransferase|nr:GNAT family protein [Actinomycetota bacterium]
MLRGERVVLRPIQSSDHERLYQLVETIEVRALSSNDPPLPVSFEEFQAKYTAAEEGSESPGAWFAIDVEGELVGECGLHSIEHYQQRAEVGISLGRESWGRGYGQDAVRTLLGYGFRTLNLEKISLHVIADDERAVGAYRKAGFVEEGRLRSHLWYDGRRHDELVMSVLRDDWKGEASASAESSASTG